MLCYVMLCYAYENAKKKKNIIRNSYPYMAYEKIQDILSCYFNFLQSSLLKEGKKLGISSPTHVPRTLLSRSTHQLLGTLLSRSTHQLLGTLLIRSTHQLVLRIFLSSIRRDSQHESSALFAHDKKENKILSVSAA